MGDKAVSSTRLPLDEYLTQFTPEALDRLRAHPRFPEALRRSCLGALDLYEIDRKASTVLKDVGRFYSGMLCVYLHSTGGLTLTRVRQHCADTGLISPGAAEALLGYLRDQGFLEPAPEQPNRREVRLVMAKPFLDSFKQRIGLEVEAAAMLRPDLAPLLAAWDRPGVFEAFMAVQGRDMAQGAPGVGHGGSAIVNLFSRNAGPLMLFRILSGAEPDDSFPPTRPVPVSITALATEFEVARSHVGRFLQDGEEIGAFERLEDDRAVRLTPLIVHEFSKLFASMYAQTHSCANEIMPGLGLA
jgi:hypothetical protein